MKRRQGYTLIELVIAMSVASSLLVVAIGVVHRVMSIYSASTQQTRLQNVTSRLARQFRNDSHRAESILLKDNTLAMSIPTPAGPRPTTYTIEGPVVTRVQQGGTHGPHLESYRFDTHATISFNTSSDSQSVTLKVNQQGAASKMPSRVLLQVDAIRGRLIPSYASQEAP